MKTSGAETVAADTKPRTWKRFYGWNILAASALTNGFGGSLHWQGFTVFFIPISQSLGLTSAQTAMPFALSRAENGLMGPLTGWLIDRYGVRRLMFIGTLMTGIGLATAVIGSGGLFAVTGLAAVAAGAGMLAWSGIEHAAAKPN